MIIDSMIILILGIIFSTLSLTDRCLDILKRKGVFKNISDKIHKKKLILEQAINGGKDIMEDKEVRRLIGEIKEDIDDVVDLKREIIDLISISSLRK